MQALQGRLTLFSFWHILLQHLNIFQINTETRGQENLKWELSKKIPDWTIYNLNCVAPRGKRSRHPPWRVWSTAASRRWKRPRWPRAGWRPSSPWPAPWTCCAPPRYPPSAAARPCTRSSTGCFKTSCKFLRLVTQSFFGLFPVFWAFLYHKLWAIFHSSTSGTWNWKKGW